MVSKLPDVELNNSGEVNDSDESVTNEEVKKPDVEPKNSGEVNLND